jgi:hypothetical protein
LLLLNRIWMVAFSSRYKTTKDFNSDC